MEIKQVTCTVHDMACMGLLTAGMLLQLDISRHGSPLQCGRNDCQQYHCWLQAACTSGAIYAAKTPGVACSNQVHGRTQALTLQSASHLAHQTLNLQRSCAAPSHLFSTSMAALIVFINCFSAHQLRSRAAPGRLYVGRPPPICIWPCYMPKSAVGSMFPGIAECEWRLLTLDPRMMYGISYL